MVNTALKGTDFRLSEKIAQIKVVITDNDGVLTDTGVYYSSDGEELKRYSVRDGMGVERLRTLTGIDTMIITGENSPSLVKRAEKLRIKNLFLNARNKIEVLHQILNDSYLSYENFAYIGDDYNDLEILSLAGLSGCPADAMLAVKAQVDYICHAPGGFGAFREFAELIIHHKTTNRNLPYGL